MPYDKQYIPTERGTLTFPWGENRRVIEVVGIVAEDVVEVVPFQGPGMGGQENHATHPQRNIVSLVGPYTASNEASMLACSGLRGDAEIQMGTGEKWAGEVLLISSRLTSKYVSKTAQLEMAIKFIKNTAVTRIPAGT